MSPGVGSRREGRERALSLLYEAEAKNLTPTELLAELPLVPSPFVADLVEGVNRDHEVIDDLIDRYAIDWSVERMPVVDRNVLRVAVYELLRHPDVPLAAVISEAVELAKSLSTDESPRFVNGLLARVLQLKPSLAP